MELGEMDMYYDFKHKFRNEKFNLNSEKTVFMVWKFHSKGLVDNK